MNTNLITSPSLIRMLPSCVSSMPRGNQWHSEQLTRLIILSANETTYTSTWPALLTNHVSTSLTSSGELFECIEESMQWYYWEKAATGSSWPDNLKSLNDIHRKTLQVLFYKVIHVLDHVNVHNRSIPWDLDLAHWCILQTDWLGWKCKLMALYEPGIFYYWLKKCHDISALCIFKAFFMSMLLLLGSQWFNV